MLEFIITDTPFMIVLKVIIGASIAIAWSVGVNIYCNKKEGG